MSTEKRPERGWRKVTRAIRIDRRMRMEALALVAVGAAVVALGVNLVRAALWSDY